MGMVLSQSIGQEVVNLSRHSGEGRNPEVNPWTPACAGMTT